MVSQNHGTKAKRLLMSVDRLKTQNLKKKVSLPGGLEPPTFRLTAERANQLRHGSFYQLRVSNFQPFGYIYIAG